jgi:hypothetical protein
MKRILILLAALAAALPASSEVAVTVYNDGMALVKDVRDLEVPAGKSWLELSGVAAMLDPTSVRFRATDDARSFEVLEQNFDYDLASVNKLYQRYLEEEITVYTDSGAVTGALLSYSDALLLQTPRGLVSLPFSQVRRVEFSSLPEGLRSRPTLRWLVASRSAGERPCETAYLAYALNWHAEYTALVSTDEKRLSLSGWVSIENESGATYENAKLKVVAGALHRVYDYYDTGILLEGEFLSNGDDYSGFAEEEFFEYHLYDLGRPTTLADRQIKQIALISEATTPCEKVFTYDYWRNTDRCIVTIEFQNEAGGGLGIPLPAGTVRLMQEASDGAYELIGEDYIEHTPRDERVVLIAGEAFDIVAERTNTDSRRIGKKWWEDDYSVVLRNHKTEDVDVVVVEHLYRFYTIRNASQEPFETTADEARFRLHIPVDGEATLTYTVRYPR